jgi:hypothetical protein
VKAAVQDENFWFRKAWAFGAGVGFEPSKQWRRHPHNPFFFFLLIKIIIRDKAIV